MILDDDERAKRLQAIRDRVRVEALKEPLVEVVAIEEPEEIRSSAVDRRSRRAERRESEQAPPRVESLDERLGDDVDDEAIAVRSRRRQKIEATLQRGGEVPTIRKAAVMLIVAGSFLGLLFGGLLFSADTSDLLGGLELTSDASPSVSGIVQSALDIENGTDGETVEGAEVMLLQIDGDAIIARTFTGSDGRFLFEDVVAEQVAVEVRQPGNVTERRLIKPGERAQLVITLATGSGVDEIDLRTESHLDQSVALGTAISAVTVGAALLGLLGGWQAHRAVAYRRTQWLCGLAMFSRGGIFIGPTLILAGMVLLTIAKQQFADVGESSEGGASVSGGAADESASDGDRVSEA